MKEGGREEGEERVLDEGEDQVGVGRGRNGGWEKGR